MILNLTRHTPTFDQANAGVIDLPTEAKDRVRDLLTFNSLPTKKEISTRAAMLALEVLMYKVHHPNIKIDTVMIGGAPFLMSALENKLKQLMFKPVYAYSLRTVEERQIGNGESYKEVIFKHLGFVEV